MDGISINPDDAPDDMAIMNPEDVTLAVAVNAAVFIVFGLFFLAFMGLRRRQRGEPQPIAGYECGQGASSSCEGHVLFKHERLPTQTIQRRASAFRDFVNTRRSVRFFDPSATVPLQVIEDCILAAGSAPSGAHCQPWTFCVVASAGAKADVRTAVEDAEKVNYDQRMGKEWVGEVNHLVKGLPEPWCKPYLTDAPYLIVVMKKTHEIGAVDAGTGKAKRVEMRYPAESTGIAVGLLLAAIHNANLVTLTSTPMSAGTRIREALGRPDNEKVFLLLPVGFPAADATVPFRQPKAADVEHQMRKGLSDIMSVH
jgi:iodotyrosine deiodinase